MEDTKIYELAHQVLEAVREERDANLYAKIGGSLRTTWSIAKSFNAWAESAGSHSDPPQHAIGMHYELARQLYRDCEEFCAFAENELSNDPFKELMAIYGGGTILPTCFKHRDCVTFMFIAGFTWVIFHELGHLDQEHGYIRSKFSGEQDGETFATTIEECDANSSTPLSGRAATLHHVTELAADFYANLFCVLDLIRQFTPQNVDPAKTGGVEFIGASTLLVCALTLIFYRFNGPEFTEPPAEALGGHPNPIYRLEASLPQIYELIDRDEIRSRTGHNLDRKGLVVLYGKAMYGTTFFCLSRMLELPGIPVHGLVQGALNKPATLQYFTSIIDLWDEILPEIEKVARFSKRTSMMRFSDQFRDRLNVDRGGESNI